jgi:hypothetical protein
MNPVTNNTKPLLRPGGKDLMN